MHIEKLFGISKIVEMDPAKAWEKAGNGTIITYCTKKGAVLGTIITESAKEAAEFLEGSMHISESNPLAWVRLSNYDKEAGRNEEHIYSLLPVKELCENEDISILSWTGIAYNKAVEFLGQALGEPLPECFGVESSKGKENSEECLAFLSGIDRNTKSDEWDREDIVWMIDSLAELIG